MTNIAMARRRVEDAATLEALLDVAYAAFGETMSAILDYPDDFGSAFAAFAFAAAAAAECRDALATAPSLSRLRSRSGSVTTTLPDLAWGIDDLAGALSGLAAVLAAALAAAARTAVAADRDVCCAAARYAGEIYRLLTQTES